MKLISNISTRFNSKSMSIFVVSISLLALFAFGNKRFDFTNSKGFDKNCIRGDGGGYYAYLPQLFIYNTNHFEFSSKIDKKYRQNFFAFEKNMQNDKVVNKYFVGTSICMTPLFLVAHFYTKAIGGDADGYSLNYQLSVFISALLFWLLGVINIFNFLKKYKVSRVSILFGILGLTFGTNLIYYITVNPSLSHVYSFGLIAFFVNRLKMYIDNNTRRGLLLLFAVLGLITLIRPTNFLIILIIPYFFDSFNHFWNQIKKIAKNQFTDIFFGFFIFSSLIFIQLLNVHSQIGIWSLNGYTKEGFDYLFNPKIPEVLFGFRKGLFIYTPFLLLIFPGLFYIFKTNKHKFYWFLIFSLVHIYILSSWWCWYYGSGFGLRPMIDVYAILVIPIIFLFHRVNNLFKFILAVFTVFIFQYNSILLYQYGKTIIDNSDMNKELFFKVFLQTGERFQCILDNNPPSFEMKNYQLNSTYFYNSNQKKWIKFDSPSPPVIKNEVSRLVYIPDSTFSQSKIAIQLKFSQRLNSQKSVPRVQLFGYKNQEKVEISVDFFGSRIPQINKFYSIDANLTSKFKYADFDSLEIFFDNEKAKLKDLSCNFYFQKNLRDLQTNQLR